MKKLILTTLLASSILSNSQQTASAQMPTTAAAAGLQLKAKNPATAGWTFPGGSAAIIFPGFPRLSGKMITSIRVLSPLKEFQDG